MTNAQCQMSGGIAHAGSFGVGMSSGTAQICPRILPRRAWYPADILCISSLGRSLATPSGATEYHLRCRAPCCRRESCSSRNNDVAASTRLEASRDSICSIVATALDNNSRPHPLLKREASGPLQRLPPRQVGGAYHARCFRYPSSIVSSCRGPCPRGSMRGHVFRDCLGQCQRRGSDDRSIRNRNVNAVLPRPPT